MLSLTCLTTEEGTTAAKRHLIINTASLIQPKYLENALTSNLKSNDMSLWKEILLLFRQEMKVCGFIVG